MVKFSTNNISIEGLINSLPGIIWIKNKNLDYVASTQGLNKFVGFPTKDYIIGRDDYHLPWECYAKAYRDGDKEVIDKRKAVTFLHPIRFYNNHEGVILTHKSPLFDESQEIVGVSGAVSIISKTESIQNILKLHQHDLDLTSNNQKHNPIQYILSDDFSRFDLSKRETSCLFYLIRGKTAKEIAACLFISKRTAEKHLDSIKLKLNCKNKSEVIAKAIDMGLIHLIPSDFLMSQY